MDYNGFLAAEHTSAIKEIPIRNGYESIADHFALGVRETKRLNAEIIPSFTIAEREQNVYNVELIKPFVYDTGILQPNELKGFFTWGDGNIPPRRHPLDISWRNPRK